MPSQETKVGKNIFVFPIYQIISIRIYFHFLYRRLFILTYSVLEKRWKYYLQPINSMLNLIEFCVDTTLPSWLIAERLGLNGVQYIEWLDQQVFLIPAPITNDELLNGVKLFYMDLR